MDYFYDFLCSFYPFLLQNQSLQKSESNQHSLLFESQKSMLIEPFHHKLAVFIEQKYHSL